MPPWQGGGNMIADVTFERTQYQPAPNKFEAGTGNIADAVGLAPLSTTSSASAWSALPITSMILAYATHGLVAGARPG